MTQPRLSVGLALVLAGVVFLLDALAVLDLWAAAGGWWPLLIVVCGVVLLVHWRSTARPPDSAPLRAFLTRRMANCRDRPFGGGKVIAVLGHAELDLDKSSLRSDGATVKVVAVLGDVAITTPPGWAVTLASRKALADVEVDVLPAPDDAPVLEIRGFVALGDLHVRTASQVP